MFSPNDELVRLYRKRARGYDSTAERFERLGYRESHYRERAVEALGLKPGDTVVEVGSGTGLNFPLLQRKIGSRGRIIGVDMTDAMIEKARKRVRDEGWTNVELVHADAASFEFPSALGGILSTFAFTLIPEFDALIQNGCRALRPEGRWAILDYRVPPGGLSLLKPLLLVLLCPFGYSAEALKRRPWESLDKYAEKTTLTEFFRGFVYLATGESREQYDG